MAVYVRKNFRFSLTLERLLLHCLKYCYFTIRHHFSELSETKAILYEQNDELKIHYVGNRPGARSSANQYSTQPRFNEFISI